MKSAALFLLTLTPILILGCQDSSSVDLSRAIEEEDFQRIRLYVQQGGDLNIEKQNPLLLAMTKRKKRSYLALLKYGANPNFFVSDVRAVLHFAAYEPDSYWINTSLQHGADPDLVHPETSDQKWISPLECAVSSGNLDNVKALIDFGADPDRVDPIDGTALSIASRRCQYEIAFYLLESGADYGMTDLESSMFLSDIASQLKDAEKCPNPNIRDPYFKKIVAWLEKQKVRPEQIEFRF